MGTIYSPPPPPVIIEPENTSSDVSSQLNMGGGTLYSGNGDQLAAELFSLGVSMTVGGIYTLEELNPPEFTAPPFTLYEPPAVPDIGDLPTLAPVDAPNFSGAAISIPLPPTEPDKVVAPAIPSVGAPAYTGGDYNSPNFAGAEPAVPDFPSTPATPGLKDIQPVVVAQPPDLSATNPNIDIPVAPAGFDKTAPAMDSLQPVQLPVTPDDTLPNAPALEQINLPEPPVIIYPSFDAVLAGGPADPDATFAWTSTDYQSELLDKLRDQLAYWMDKQGVGIPDEVWTAIWQRAKEREDVIALKARQESSEEFASRGFSLPPGAMLSQSNKIIQINQNKSSSLSRDAAIKQAEMEIEQQRFYATEISRLELGLAENDVAIQRLSFDGAKAAIDASISIYSAQVNRYNADVQAYRTEAEVYKTRFESEKIKLDLYRSSLEGEKIKGELNTQKIQNYTAQIAAVQATFDLYRTQLEGARFTIDENSQLIEKYKASIEGYAVEARAAAIRTDIYSATIGAEQLKISGFASEVDAYQAQIRAYSALTTANTEAKGQEIDVERFKIDKFRAEIDAVNAQIGGLSEQLRGAVQVYDSQVRRYTADVDGEGRRVTSAVGIHSANIDAYKAEVDRDVSAAGIDVEASKANSQVYDAKVRGFGVQVDAETRRYEGDVSKFKADIDGYKASGDRDVAGARIATDGILAKTSLYDAEVRGYVGLTNAEASRFGAEATLFGEEIKAFQTVAQQDMEQARLALNEYLGVLQSADAKLSASARLSGQLGSAAISSHNTSSVSSVSMGHHSTSGGTVNVSSSVNTSNSTGYSTMVHAGGTDDHKEIDSRNENHIYNHDG